MAPGSMEAFARVGGDRNPLHRSVLAARMAGLPRPIAHGAWTAARAGAFVVDELCDGDAHTAARLAGELPGAGGARARRWTSRRRASRFAPAGVPCRCGCAWGTPTSRSVRRSSIRPRRRCCSPARASSAPGSQTTGARSVWRRADAHTRERARLLAAGGGRAQPARAAARRRARGPAPAGRPVPDRVHAGGAGRARGGAAGRAARGRRARRDGDARRRAQRRRVRRAACARRARRRDRGRARVPPRRGDAGPRAARRGRLVAVPDGDRQVAWTGCPRASRSSTTTRPASTRSSGTARRGRRPRPAGDRRAVPLVVAPGRGRRRSGRTSRLRGSMREQLVGRWVPNVLGRVFEAGDDVVELLAQPARLAGAVDRDAAHARGAREALPRDRARARVGPDRAGADDGRRTSSCCTPRTTATRCWSERRCPPRRRCPPGRTRPLAHPNPWSRRRSATGRSTRATRSASCSRCRRASGSISSTRARRSTSSSRACPRGATRC